MSKYRITISGKTYEMEIERVDEIVESEDKQTGTAWKPGSAINSSNPNVQVIDPAISKKTVNTNNVIHSPMPGTIIKLFARNGDVVKEGQAVLILEAMKMENEITAPISGTIAGLNIAEKQTVQGGAVLFEIIE